MFSLCRPAKMMRGDFAQRLVSSSRSWSDHTAAHQPARLDLSAASSPALEAAMLGQEIRPERDQIVEWKEVENEVRTGHVSLHSTMQSNVPDPYRSGNRGPSATNMPGTTAARRQQTHFVAGERIQLINGETSAAI